MCEKYLFWVDRYSTDGFHIFYQKQTWIDKNMAPNFIFDMTINALYTTKHRLQKVSAISFSIWICTKWDFGLMFAHIPWKNHEKRVTSIQKWMLWYFWIGWRKCFSRTKTELQAMCSGSCQIHVQHQIDRIFRTFAWKLEQSQLADTLTRWSGPPKTFSADWKSIWKISKMKLLAHVKIIAPAPKHEAKALADTFPVMDYASKLYFPR